MAAHGEHLHMRLFLEGIEVPVVAAVIQTAPNSPASASIQVIATDRVLDLLPRTVVHLFYYDYLESSDGAAARMKQEMTEEDMLNTRYKVLFVGELVSIKFQKTAGSRAVVLECSDLSNYWDTTFQYNFEGSLFGGRRQAAFIGANSNFFTSPLGHGAGTVSRLLNGNSVNFPELRGLLAGVVRMLEAIGGAYYGTNTFRGANDFSSIAELRLKILQQITAAEKDTSTAKLFARKAFTQWMNQSMTSLGKLVSFRSLVNTCFSFIFHEVYPCPVAKFIPASTRQQTRNSSIGLEKSGQYPGFVKMLKDTLALATNATNALTAWRETKTGQSSTRQEQSLAATSYVHAWKAFDTSAKQLATQGAVMGPKGTDKDLSIIGQTVAEINALTTNGGISANWKYGDTEIGTLDQNHSRFEVLYTKVINLINDLLDTQLGRSKTVTVPTESRLNNQIFRPDVWYTSPPRCNVLFPELYDSLNFGRQYLREVSRMELQTHNEILGSDALLNGRYYAPNVQSVRDGSKLSTRAFARIIMDHELYTGIIPMFENMSEVNLYAMRSGKVTKAGGKVSYAQRAVNFQYFKYRFESRGMDASGRFNPVFVPGFPSLIIDKPMDLYQLQLSALNLEDQAAALGVTGETTRSGLLKELVSPQYLGVVAAVTHSMSQQGGRTSYQFIHCRVHREDTEFLGVDKADVYKASGKAIQTSTIGAPKLFPPKKKQRGPLGGIIVDVKDVTEKHRGRVIDLLAQDKKAVVGQSYPYSFFSGAYTFDQTEVEIEVGAYDVQETRTRYIKGTIDLPIEEAIRPSWLWDGWADPKVTETYNQMFGIGAITEINSFNLPPTQDPSSGARSLLTDTELAGLDAERRGKSSGPGRKSAAGQTNPRAAAIAEASKNQNAALKIEQERTIENCVDFLVRAYSFARVNDLDVGEFVKSYTWRPVATMVDILGSSDLQIKQVPKQTKRVVKQRVVKNQAKTVTYALRGGGTRTEALTKPAYGYQYVTRTFTDVGYQVEGIEGFHSRSFGDVEDLFGLVNPTVTRVLGLTENQRKVASKLDVRKRRRSLVRAYVAELTGSRGLVG